MSLLPSHGAALRSVRMHGASGDPLRARQQLERALAEVEWSPPGLPPRALLFVRRLVADGRRGLRPHSEGGSFGRGVSAALRGHAQVARRPWLHDDAAQADAVMFVDEAELIACLWRDWTRGRLPQRWWWRSVLGGQDALAWLRLKAWPRAEWMVPALALLAARGDAPDCVARLEARDAERALQAVKSAYGLVHLGDASAVVPAGDDRAATWTEPAGALPAERGSPLSTALRRLVSLAPELNTSRLASAQRRLLAVALGVVREPAWARTPTFAAAVAEHTTIRWAEERVAVRPSRFDARDAGRSSVAEPQPHRVADDAPISSSPALPQRREVPTANATTFVEATPHDAAIEAQPPVPSIAKRIEAAPLVEATLMNTPLAAPRRDTTPAPVDAAPRSIRTRYGGLFYLLNAALALRVYGDFTMPRHPDLPLSPWDLLAWTGRAWFGDAFVRDPLWPLLATLSGRAPAQPPGHDFDAAPDWRIDPDWLAPWGAVACLHVHATRQRLRVLHPQGFALFDVRRDITLKPLRQARRLCGDQTLRRAQPPFGRVPRCEGARWLHHWRAYLEARLRVTLDTDTDVPALLCRHDAEVRVGAGHVDVHLALAGLPLSLRFAGLDRDPGWVPAAGRCLSFHFE